MNLQLANEIASNVLQILSPFGEHMLNNPIKYIKLYPIIIEGLDCVGKNTLSNSLLTKIKDQTENVILLSFPRYETDTGKKIKELLHTEGTRSAIIEQQLWTLMIQDRMDALSAIRNIYDIPENKDKVFYVIFDRFFLSNMAYGVEPINKTELLELVNDSPVYKLAEFESDTFFGFMNNENRGVSIILSYNENDPDKAYIPGLQGLMNKSKEIHKEFLDKKLNKDSNENMNKQLIVSSIYDINGIDKKFHKVNFYFRYRPAESLSNIMYDNIIPQIMEVLK